MAKKEIARIKLSEFPGNIDTQISADGKYVIVSSETDEPEFEPIDVTRHCHVELRKSNSSGGSYIRLVCTYMNKEALVAVIGTRGFEIQDASMFSIITPEGAIKSFQVIKKR